MLGFLRAEAPLQQCGKHLRRYQMWSLVWLHSILWLIAVFIFVYQLRGEFFQYFIQHCFICLPSDSTVSEDAGIEPRTVATSALTVRRSNYSARYLPHSARSARAHPRSARSHQPIDCFSHTISCEIENKTHSIFNWSIVFPLKL